MFGRIRKFWHTFAYCWKCREKKAFSAHRDFMCESCYKEFLVEEEERAARDEECRIAEEAKRQEDQMIDVVKRAILELKSEGKL